MTDACKVVAEIGASHLGKMDRAKALCFLAKNAGADYAKFQKRNPEESVPAHLLYSPHPNPVYAYGETYLQHRKALEFSIEQHRELKKYCESIGIKYATSVWDLTSAFEVLSLEPDYIKVPSACNMHFQLIDALFNGFAGKVHLSLGMVSKREKNIIIDKYISRYADRLVFYHCTSEYPVPFERLFLKEIINLAETEAEVGFSNHGYGIAADIAAYTLGATWIERHFIDDRTVRHSDAAASLEFSGLQKLVRDLHSVQKALAYRDEDITEEEIRQRQKLSCTHPERIL